MIGRKTSLQENPVVLALVLSLCMKQVQKNTSDLQLIEPRVYKLGTTLMFQKSDILGLQIGSLQGHIASQMLVKGNKDSWYEGASIPAETTNQSVRKNNL